MQLGTNITNNPSLVAWVKNGMKIMILEGKHVGGVTIRGGLSYNFEDAEIDENGTLTGKYEGVVFIFYKDDFVRPE